MEKLHRTSLMLLFSCRQHGRILPYHPGNFHQLFSYSIRLASCSSFSSTPMCLKKVQSSQVFNFQHRFLRTKASSASESKKSPDEAEMIKKFSKETQEFIGKLEKTTGSKINVKHIKDGKITFMEPAKVLRFLGIWLIMVIFTCFLFKRFIDKTDGKNLSHLLSNDPITVEEFIDKFLANGEVEKVAVFILQKKAVAMLHPGAVIDGESFGADAVTVNLTGNRQDLTSLIRSKEKMLGIADQNCVPVEFIYKLPPLLEKGFYLYFGICSVILILAAGKLLFLLRALKFENKKKPPKS